MKQNRSFAKTIRDLELHKEITYEWLDLFRNLSAWLIKNCVRNRIPLPEKSRLVSSHENAGLILDKLEHDNIPSSFKDYIHSMNEFEKITGTVIELMLSFKSRLVWFFDCCDKNNIKIQDFDGLLAMVSQSERLRDRLEKRLSDESIKQDNHERFNGELRDREKVMRGLKKKDTPILTGYQIYHNYVRPHEGLQGKTPAECCGIDIQGQNKWITLIENAKRDQ